ncbi:MAG: helix-turn-helix domain-containing protein [Chitinophagaceae bacterium]|nr:MAG: helix-turn-helix domain-containing protein [Chitinophagaceae bacterium]
MAKLKKQIPVYDICSIDKSAQKDLMVARFGSYLQTHYNNLHKPHRHSFYHLVLFTKGKGTHTIDFETFTVRPGQVYFMSPGQVHSWHFTSATDGYIVHFNEVLFTTFLQNTHYLERFSFFNGNATDGLRQLPAKSFEHAQVLFESMLNEIDGKGEQNIDLIRLKLLEFFILTDRAAETKKIKAVPRQKETLLRNFQQLIDQHFRSVKLPKEYAELLYVTPNHLNALSQDLTGRTAGEQIRERVLLEAKRLLISTDLTVTQIAHELEFHDNSYFNRFFKKYAGLTPEEFRKN